MKSPKINIYVVKISLFISFLQFSIGLSAQLKWKNVDADFQPLPSSMHVYRTDDQLNGKAFIAYYVEADLKDRHIKFTTDTGYHRRFSPSGYYERNNKPLLVVNGTFFNFDKNQNLNVVMRDGKLLAYNEASTRMKGKDSMNYRYPLKSAIGISKSRHADVAWLFTDSSYTKPFQFQSNYTVATGTRPSIKKNELIFTGGNIRPKFKKWKMETAIGGGPVLIQNGKVDIYNNQELRFAGKAIDDKHPRTCMGYTADGKLIIMVIQGRFPNVAEGASLTQEANILKDLGCVEALNLDGGGSSCMLVNGRETIKPSDPGGQRPTPAVFIIK